MAPMVTAFPGALLASNEDQRAEGMRSSALARGSRNRAQRACDSQCERPRTPDKHPVRAADMGLHDRDLPQRILHAARRLQLCGRTQAAARLADLVAAGFHPRLFPQIIDPGRTHRAGHGQGMFISQQQERLEMRAMKANRDRA